MQYLPISGLGPFTKTFVSDECTKLDKIQGDLKTCKDTCKKTPGCTVISYSYLEDMDCYLRACPLPVPQPTGTNNNKYYGYKI